MACTLWPSVTGGAATGACAGAGSVAGTACCVANCGCNASATLLCSIDGTAVGGGAGARSGAALTMGNSTSSTLIVAKCDGEVMQVPGGALNPVSKAVSSTPAAPSSLATSAVEIPAVFGRTGSSARGFSSSSSESWANCALESTAVVCGACKPLGMTWSSNSACPPPSPDLKGSYAFEATRLASSSSSSSNIASCAPESTAVVCGAFKPLSMTLTSPTSSPSPLSMSSSFDKASCAESKTIVVGGAFAPRSMTVDSSSSA
mmetsp:Transcript_48427/g.135283  ORF Transcript_48427/g.135283 Transcript_48427/m.135283 type:complete len:261 (+) Transcript_48427:158-940(+)